MKILDGDLFPNYSNFLDQRNGRYINIIAKYISLQQFGHL